MNHFYKYIVLLIFIFFSCHKQENNNGINEDNLEQKIESAYRFAIKDDPSESIPILFYIDENNISFEDLCLLAKVDFLRATKASFLDNEDALILFLNKSLANANNCNDNEFYSYLYNLKAIYYAYIGESKENRKFVELSIEYGEKLENHLFLSDTYYNYARLLTRQKEWLMLHKIANKAIKMQLESGETLNTLKYFYIFLAKANIGLKKYDEAEEVLRNTKKMIVEIPSTKKLDRIKGHIEFFGTYKDLYSAKNQYKEAFRYSNSLDSISGFWVQYNTEEVRDLAEREIVLKENLSKSNKKLIQRQSIIIFTIIAFVIFILVTLYRNKKKSAYLETILLDKEKLYNDLQVSSLETEKRNKEIKNLLEQNEKILLSKTFKISLYKEGLDNLANRFEKLYKDKDKVASSKLFSINNSLREIISDNEIWEDFKIEFEKSRPNFFKNLLLINPNLSVTEQKHCAYLVVDLSAKEVANLINLSPRSVETARYRIKKKLGLTDESLSIFLKNIV
ncbi:hypothetical protein N9V96_00565 [Polaribacter sp.]|nr:hypothetical protein [Polaribacter sp.]